MPKKAKCAFCSGNAIARGLCVICMTPLCRRHTHVVKGKTYCRGCKPGYVV